MERENLGQVKMEAKFAQKTTHYPPSFPGLDAPEEAEENGQSWDREKHYRLRAEGRQDVVEERKTIRKSDK